MLNSFNLRCLKFIEMVDNVIAITAWDKLQSTVELEKIANRRTKDKFRKREERTEMKKLMMASSDTFMDMSEDSPRTSMTTKKDSESDKTTIAASTRVKDVVVGNDELNEIFALIPPQEISRRLQVVIYDAVKIHGKDTILSNVIYALKHHNLRKGKLGGMICAAIMQDFAGQDREAAVAEEKVQTASRYRREKDLIAKKELEEREHREAQSQQAVWLSLAPEEQSELARQARDKFTCLPKSMFPLETDHIDADAIITKIIAAMYADGELVLPAGRGSSGLVVSANN
jgi:hypothetical protein